MRKDVAGLLAAAADLTLIVDAKGVIIDAAASAECNAPVREWVGRPWIDTVTIESRPKIEALLRDAQKGDDAARAAGQPSGAFGP